MFDPFRYNIKVIEAESFFSPVRLRCKVTLSVRNTGCVL